MPHRHHLTLGVAGLSVNASVESYAVSGCQEVLHK